jgi:hypothetical protein
MLSTGAARLLPSSRASYGLYLLRNTARLAHGQLSHGHVVHSRCISGLTLTPNMGRLPIQ